MNRDSNPVHQNRRKSLILLDKAQGTCAFPFLNAKTLVTDNAKTRTLRKHNSGPSSRILCSKVTSHEIEATCETLSRRVDDKYSLSLTTLQERLMHPPPVRHPRKNRKFSNHTNTFCKIWNPIFLPIDVPHYYFSSHRRIYECSNIDKERCKSGDKYSSKLTFHIGQISKSLPD